MPVCLSWGAQVPKATETSRRKTSNPRAKKKRAAMGLEVKGHW